MSVTTQIISDLAHVVIDNPPVNATSAEVRAGLMDALNDIAGSSAKMAILSCTGRTFVAGADVREFGKPLADPQLPDVLLAIEASPVPWVAAIHGTALGGGLELCLACAYRVATDTARVGLPEVTLGLIPGAGGTVRLPRLIAPEHALDIIAGGRMVPAAKALSLGLLDAVVPDATEGAKALAHKVMHAPRPVPLSQRAAIAPGPDFANAVAATKGKAKGQNSVVAAADAVVRAVALDGPAALAAERDAFLTLKDDPQSVALRHVFFAERAVGKLALTKGVDAAAVRHIGIVGGGTMGSGIAAACLMAGLSVTMVERDSAAAGAGAERVDAILEGALKRGKLSKAQSDATKAAFGTAINYAALADADLVIEAVFEDMAVKQEVFQQLEANVRADAILATNTSYLDVAALAARLQHPERVIGLHFFSPAHVMKLLEVIVPERASPVAVATGMALGKRLGKITVPAGVCDGFIGNRIMSAYRREADYMIVDGALPQEVDAAMRDFGFAIGVFQMQDLAGLDIAWAMRKRRAATRAPEERYVTVADQLCEAGRLGRKTGQGWYTYHDNPKGDVDPTVTAMIEAESVANGITRAPMDAATIMARLIAVMQAEGAAILREGIAATPDAIDVVMINGYGFPRWRGGPMYMQGRRT